MLTHNTNDKEQNEENKRSMFVVCYIAFAVIIVIIIVLGLVILKHNKKEKTKPTVTETTVNANDASELVTKEIDQANEGSVSISNSEIIESDANIEELIEKAQLGVETFTYTAYCQLDTRWNEEYTDEELQEFQDLGGTDEDFNGISILAIVGNITPTREILTVLSQRNMVTAMESRSTQTIFDFKTKKSYSNTNDLIKQTTTGWTESDLQDTKPIIFNDFFEDLSYNDVTEDDLFYYIHGVYNYNATQDNNVMNWVLGYILGVFDLDIQNSIPLTIVLDKKTLQVKEINYELTEVIGQSITNMYDITDTQLKVTVKDINNTNILIPDELIEKFQD